ncbi:MAG TPA: hypothetical protein VGD40_10010 [Chryseosolibacter sp.]
MKPIITLLLLSICSYAMCQKDNTQILEQRAKDFHVAISKDDKEVWRKFMNNNFTNDLIERPMRAKISTSENDGTNTSSNNETRVAEKLHMFQQLHEDFGSGNISSITVTGNTVKMIVTAGGRKGIFLLTCEDKPSWLIDKLGIEVEAEN